MRVAACALYHKVVLDCDVIPRYAVTSLRVKVSRYFSPERHPAIRHTHVNKLISNFVKIRSVGSDLFLADGRTKGQNRRTYMRKLMVAIRSFVKEAIKLIHIRVRKIIFGDGLVYQRQDRIFCR